MRITDGGTTGEGPVVSATEAPARPEEPKEEASGVTRDGGSVNTAPAAGSYKTKH